MEYSIQLSQVEDNIDINWDRDPDNHALVNCVLVAHRFFDTDIWDPWDLKVGFDKERGDYEEQSDDEDEDEEEYEMPKGRWWDHWSYEQYVECEGTLWMLMDFCLFPRSLSYLKDL
mmetsp:Transcript_12223/g.17376  ORF Transcript_12223/g.17376 Transcript_12223/m.17376 type:complete len:116 (-) Transcript_12223:147-494(-)